MVTNTNDSVDGIKTTSITSDVITVIVTGEDAKEGQFTVTYNVNDGGKVTGMPSDNTKYSKDNIVTVKGKPVSTSKFFAGWNTEADGTGKSYTINKTFVINGNVTLYAQWKNIVTDSAKLRYKVTGKNEVACIGTADKNTTTLSITNTMKYKGITYKITSVAKNAFKDNKKIKTVTIANNVKVINKKAFFKCSNLKKVTIGTGLEVLGNHVFCHANKGCTIIINSAKLKTVKTMTNHGVDNMVINVPKNKLDIYKELFSILSSEIKVKTK